MQESNPYRHYWQALALYLLHSNEHTAHGTEANLKINNLYIERETERERKREKEWIDKQS